MKWKAFLLFFILWYAILVITGTLFSGYHLTDDQDVLRIKQDVSGTTLVREVRIFLRDIFDAKMRFRPVHNLHRRLGVLIFGSNFIAWSFYFGILAVFTSLFLFLFIKRQGYSLLESGIFAALTLLGQQAAIWWKLGSNETLGMFFVSAAMLCMVKSTQNITPKKKIKYEILFVFFAIMASWSKESFILMIPALVVWKIWLTDEKNKLNENPSSFFIAIKQNLAVIVLLSSVCLIELIYIVKIVGTTSIGYAGVEGFKPAFFLKTGWQSMMAVHGWVIVIELLVMAFLFYLKLKKSSKYGVPAEGGVMYKNLLWMFVLAGMIVLPQIALYMKSGMMERYLLPGVIGYTILMVGLLKIIRETGDSMGLKRRFSKTIPEILILSFLIVICLQQLRVTRYTALGFSREGKQVNAFFKSIGKRTRTGDMLLIITHPRKYLEASVAFKAYLEIEMNRREMLFSSANLDIKPTKDTFWNHLNREFFSQRPGFRLNSPASREVIRGILIFPGLEERFLSAAASWFKPGLFDRYTNRGGYVGYYKKASGRLEFNKW